MDTRRHTASDPADAAAASSSSSSSSCRQSPARSAAARETLHQQTTPTSRPTTHTGHRGRAHAHAPSRPPSVPSSVPRIWRRRGPFGSSLCSLLPQLVVLVLLLVLALGWSMHAMQVHTGGGSAHDTHTTYEEENEEQLAALVVQPAAAARHRTPAAAVPPAHAKSTMWLLGGLLLVALSACCYLLWERSLLSARRTDRASSALLEATVAANLDEYQLPDAVKRSALRAALAVAASQMGVDTLEPASASPATQLLSGSSLPVAANARRSQLLKSLTTHNPSLPSGSSGRPRVLLTGGAGFIGSHVAKALLARGEDIVVVDEFNDAYDPALKFSNLDQLEQEYGRSRIHTYVADICDELVMARIFQIERYDRIIHLAARAGVRPSLVDPSLYVRSNIQGTLTLLEVAKNSKGAIKHFVYASSSSVYGETAPVPFTEDDPTNTPVSPYAATKKSCELLASTYSSLYGLPCSGMRFFTVYGAGGRRDMAPSIFIDRIARGLPIVQYGDGTTERDYTYVDDIVQGVLKILDHVPGTFPLDAADSQPADALLHQVYNLGAGSPISLAGFIRTIADALGVQPLIDHKPIQLGDVTRTYANITKAKRLVGYAPTVTVQEGIRRTVEWYLRTQRNDRTTQETHRQTNTTGGSSDSAQKSPTRRL